MDNQSRIIDRPKERFSDGVSFSYVPELLNYCNAKMNCSVNDLYTKELNEKKYLMNLILILNILYLIVKCLNGVQIVNKMNTLEFHNTQ